MSIWLQVPLEILWLASWLADRQVENTFSRRVECWLNLCQSESIELACNRPAVSHQMKMVQLILGVCIVISGAVFVVCWFLVWFKVIDVNNISIALGIPMTFIGLHCLCAAADKDGNRGFWKRSDIKVGRISELGFGVGFLSVGIVFLRIMPKSWNMVAVIGFLIAMALVVNGQSMDHDASQSESQQSSDTESRANNE